MEFNINECVKVKLTEKGREIHKANWDDLMKCTPFIYHPPLEDEDGWSTWQMWDLMKIFGKYISMGLQLPFETTIKIEVRDEK